MKKLFLYKTDVQLMGKMHPRCSELRAAYSSAETHNRLKEDPLWDSRDKSVSKFYENVYLPKLDLRNRKNSITAAILIRAAVFSDKGNSYSKEFECVIQENPDAYKVLGILSLDDMLVEGILTHRQWRDFLHNKGTMATIGVLVDNSTYGGDVHVNTLGALDTTVARSISHTKACLDTLSVLYAVAGFREYVSNYLNPECLMKTKGSIETLDVVSLDGDLIEVIQYTPSGLSIVKGHLYANIEHAGELKELIITNMALNTVTDMLFKWLKDANFSKGLAEQDIQWLTLLFAECEVRLPVWYL